MKQKILLAITLLTCCFRELMIFLDYIKSKIKLNEDESNSDSNISNAQ
jgi:hypothetical protein